MADYLIQDLTLSGIADKIRVLSGTEETLTPAEMVNELGNIVTLEAGTSDANAVATDILKGKTAYVNGSKVTGSMANNGAISKSLNCGGSYTIPAGYHNGSGKVTANSLASQTDGDATAAQILSGKIAYVDGSKVTGTMTNQGAKTSSLNCGGSYTIPAGYHNGSGKVTANSLASQTSADATAAQILSGKTAYVNGTKITGSIPSKAATTYTPTTSNQTIASGQYLSGVQTIKGDANLVSANILSGKTIFGVSGSAAGAHPNGTKWTSGQSLTKLYYTQYPRPLYFSNGIWLVYDGTNGIYYSTNGKTWTQTNITSANTGITRVAPIKFCYADGLYVTAINTGIYYSTNGSTWTKSNVTGNMSTVINKNGVWLSAGAGVYRSTDGKNWSQSSFPINTSSVSWGMATMKGLFEVSYSNKVYYSADGSSWSTSSTTFGSSINNLFSGGGVCLALTEGSGIYYSTDGSTWSQSNITSGNSSFAYYANGLWVAVTSTGIYYSTNGSTWTKSNVTSAVNNNMVLNANGIWVSGQYYSKDGKNWTDSGISANNACYGNGVWVNSTSTTMYYSVAWE